MDESLHDNSKQKCKKWYCYRILEEVCLKVSEYHREFIELLISCILGLLMVQSSSLYHQCSFR